MDDGRGATGKRENQNVKCRVKIKEFTTFVGTNWYLAD
jgi:hypothetical protein